MHAKKNTFALVITLVTLFSVVLVTFPSVVDAKQKEKRIKEVRFNVNDYIAGNLRFFIGKKIHITLQSGKTFTGIVKDVGKQLVHLERLEGKEYYDALIRIENISAIEARFRNHSR